MRSNKSAAILAAAVSVALGSVASAQIAIQPQALKERDFRLLSTPFTLDNGPTVTGGGSPREALVSWNAPNTGNWSVGSNWIGGVAPVANDDLQFNASGTQSYTATNDTALTYGSVQIANTGTGTVTLAGGFNANHLRIDQGKGALSGGTHTLSSLASTGVGTTATLTTMSLTVGNVAGSAEGTFTGATINGRNAYVGNHTGTTATGTFAGGTYNFLPTDVNAGTVGGRFGTNLGNANLVVNGGATVNAWLFEVGRNPGAVSNVTLSGSGTTVTANQLAMSRNLAGAATLNISNNATLNINYRTADGTPNGTINTGGGVFARSGETTDKNVDTSTINISSGGKFLNKGNAFIAAAANAVNEDVGSVATLNVDGTGSEFRSILVVRPDNAVLGQFVLADGVVGDGATGNINVTNGGLVAVNRWFSAIDRDDVANVSVSGAGSKVEVGAFAVLSGGGGTNVSGGLTTFNVTSGGNFTAGDILVANNGAANFPSSRADLLVSGAGSSLVTLNDAGELTDGEFDVALGANTRGTATITNSATATIGGNVFTSVNAGAESTVTVSNNATMSIAGQAQFGGAGGTNGGTAVVNVSSGGSMTTGGLVSLYTGARMTVNGGTVVTGGQLSAGNTPALPAGQFTVDVTGGGSLTVGSLTTPASAFFSSDATETSTVRVSGTGSQMLVTNALVLSGGGVDGIGDPVGGGLSSVDVLAGGNLTAYDISAGTFPGGSVTMNVSGAGSLLKTINTTTDNGDLIMSTGLTATASLTVGSGGTVDIGGNVVVGTNGTVNVNSGGSFLIRGGQSTTFGTLTGSGTVFNVNNGGVIKGSGVISMPTGTSVNVKSGGRMEPGFGATTGALETTANMTLEPGSTLAVDLASSADYDGVFALRTLTLTGSSLEINLLTGFTAVPADTFVIGETGASGSVVGAFSNLNAWGLITTTAGNSAFLPQYNTTQAILTDFARRGDTNRDGIVNNQDIASFVALLTGTPPTAPSALGFAADTNGDGVVNNQDIAPFVAILTGSRPLSDFSGDPEFAPLLSLVPEPASLSLLALGGLALRRRRRA